MYLLHQVMAGKLSEMNLLTEKLLDRQLDVEMEQRRREGDNSVSRALSTSGIITPLSLVMEQLVQVCVGVGVWACVCVWGVGVCVCV